MTVGFSKHRIFGVLAIGLTFFGLAPIFVRLATDYTAIQISTSRTVIATLLFLPFFLSRKREKVQNTIATRKDHILMALSGVALSLHSLSWTSSLYFTSVASASVLVTLHPIILIIIEGTFYKIRFAATVWIGVIIAFSGSLLLGLADYNAESTFANPPLGNALAILAAAMFVIYFLIGSRARKKFDLIEYLFPVYFWSGISSLVVLFIFEGFTFPFESKILWIGFALAAGPQVIGHGAVNYVIKYVPPTLISTTILAEPILATIFALIFFGELPAVVSILAMCLTLIGVSFTWRKAV